MNKIKKFFSKTQFSPSHKTAVIERYVNDTNSRIYWLSALTLTAETVMMLLDAFSGFFDEHPLNHLNLGAELLLIIGSLMVFLRARRVKQDPDQPLNIKISVIRGYRIIVILAVALFIFTDVYVRHQIIGAYMVFLFALQITPSVNAWVNWIQYVAIGLFTVILYAIVVDHSGNIIFSTIFIFVSFSISASFLRNYFLKQLDNYYSAKSYSKRFERLSVQSVLALANAVEAKDLYTKGHSQRVAEYSKEIALRYGYSEQKGEDIYFIGLMHDIGKIGIPDSVINKTGRLTDEEFAEIKKHPIIGHDILKSISELPDICEGARHHHERYDGRGYPDGLAGEEIPEMARIIAVSDAYDAMTSYRSYRSVMPQSEVREQIEKNIGTQFDPTFAKIMLQMIDEDTDYQMREQLKSK